MATKSPESAPSKSGLAPRWKPGQSGNPAGRPRGTRNRATVIAEQLIQGDAERLARTAVERALGGDQACLKLCLERIVPPARERPITLQVGSLGDAETIRSALAGIVQAVASGALLPTEGVELARLVDGYRRTLETEDLAARVVALERELGLRPKRG